MTALAMAFSITAVTASATPSENQNAEGDAATELQPPAFTDRQARQGRAVYGGLCAGCHGDDLAGLDAPPLVGDFFLGHWEDGSVAELFTFIMTSMPVGNPGSLSESRTAQLVAYILSSNDFAPGDEPLPEDPELMTEMGFVHAEE